MAGLQTYLTKRFYCCCSTFKSLHPLRGFDLKKNLFYSSFFQGINTRLLNSTNIDAGIKALSMHSHHQNFFPCKDHSRCKKKCTKAKTRHLGVFKLDMKSHRSFSSSREVLSSKKTLAGEVDRYNGVWVDLRQLLSHENENLMSDSFSVILSDSLKLWESKNITCVWLNVPIKHSRLIEVASHHNFHFHHAEGSTATLIHYMTENVKGRIPQFATHQIGVSGVAINEETQEVLVVMDKNRRRKFWKFPGGLSDLGEDIAETAVREVLEETGVKTEFRSILAFRQQHDHPNAFGRSDIYVLCRLSPLTFDLQPCSEEIAAIQWISAQELQGECQATPMTRQVAGLILHGLRHGFNTIDITSHEVESIYKKNKIQMYHRPWVNSV